MKAPRGEKSVYLHSRAFSGSDTRNESVKILR